MVDRMLLRPIEVAETLGVSRSRAYELIAANVIPAVRVGTSVRVPVEALRAWVSQQLQERAETRTAR